jgi:hypothetical protein
MNMILSDDAQNTTSEGDDAPVVRYSPTTHRPRRAPAQRRSEESAPADLPVFDGLGLDRAVAFILSDEPHPHRAYMVADEAVCLTCATAWPCGPIAHLMIAAYYGKTVDGAQ